VTQLKSGGALNLGKTSDFAVKKTPGRYHLNQGIKSPVITRG
jgi:hypothetical protein